MPWADEYFRLILHVKTEDDFLKISGTQTLHPLGFRN